MTDEDELYALAEAIYNLSSEGKWRCGNRPGWVEDLSRPLVAVRGPIGKVSSQGVAYCDFPYGTTWAIGPEVELLAQSYRVAVATTDRHVHSVYVFADSQLAYPGGRLCVDSRRHWGEALDWWFLAPVAWPLLWLWRMWRPLPALWSTKLVTAVRATPSEVTHFNQVAGRAAVLARAKSLAKNPWPQDTPKELSAAEAEVEALVARLEPYQMTIK